MAESFVERRRSPRIPVSGGARFDRPVAIGVRLLDVGVGGVLMLSPHTVEVGQFGRLNVRLNDVVVDADIEVRRAAAHRDEKGSYKLGARFVALDGETEMAMTRFLSAAGK